MAVNVNCVFPVTFWREVYEMWAFILDARKKVLYQSVR
jgi:hypothetical protein